MAKDFRSDVEFNNAVTIQGNLTASAGTTNFGNSSFRTDGNGISIYSNSASEGGQINFYGGTSYSSSVVQIDNYQGNLRILNNNGNSLALTVDNISGMITISSGLTASAGNTYLGSASMLGVSNPGAIATQAWVQAQGYSTSPGGGSTTGTGSAVYNTSPTLLGTVSASNITISGSLTASANTSTFGTTNTGNLTSSGSIVGSVVHANANNTGQNFRIGDDVWIGDINVADTMSIRGISGASANGYIRFGSDSNNFGYNGTNLLYGTEIVATRPSVQFATASLTNTSSVTFQKPTGMTGITLQANVLYRYEISIDYRVYSTNQVFKCRLNHPTVTRGGAHTVIGTNTAQVSYLGGATELTGTQTDISSTTSTNSGATSLIQTTVGIIQPSASGTFSYEFAPASSSATVFQNSYMMVTPVTSV